MRRLLLVLTLLPALASAQYPPPAEWRVPMSNWRTGPGGGQLALGLPLSSTGPMLAEDAGTTLHVYWDESARNYILHSEDLTNAAWDTSGFCTQTANQGPAGYTDLDLIDCGASPADLWQSVVLPSTTDIGVCATVAAASGTVDIRMRHNGAAGTSISGTCTRSDGVPCARTVGGTYIDVLGVTTTPVRICTSITYNTAQTNFSPGINTVGGVAFLAGRVSVVASTIPPPYAPTTSTAIAAGALQDVYPNAWTQNGTVPQVAANVSPFVPGKAGAGPYTLANYYNGGTSLLSQPGDFNVTLVWKPTSVAAQEVMFAKLNAGATVGWYTSVTAATGVFNAGYHDGSVRTATTANGVTVNGINVATFGKSGGTCYSKLNGGATASVACGNITANSAEPLLIGRYGAAASYAGTSTGYEIMGSTTPYSDALHTDRFNAVFGLLPGPVSVDRVDPISYTANGFVWSSPGGPAGKSTMGVGANGAEVWKGSTNHMEGIASSRAVGGWADVGACVVTADQGPAGYTDLDLINCPNNGTHTASKYAAYTTSSNGPGTFCATFAADTGTKRGSTIISFNGGTSSGCGCYRESGGACTASSTGGSGCYAYADFTTTPDRLCVSGSGVGTITLWTGQVRDGQYGATSAVQLLTGRGNLEAGAYMTPEIVNSGTPVARAATVASVPLPQLGNKWCASVTATPGGVWGIGNRTILASGPYGTANDWALYQTGGTFRFDLFDSANVSRIVTFAHGLSGYAPHRFTACTNNGALSVCQDGVLRANGALTGTGLQSVTESPLNLGNDAAGTTAWDGALSNLKICKGATKCSDCR